MDAYVTLGVSPAATPAEIKRAYRRLAMRWHPDRNQNAEATERFKQIRAAYDHLLTVDLPDEQEIDDEAPAEPAESSAQAADLRLNLEISLEDAASGCRQTIHYARSKACATCVGTGESGMSRTRFCEACHGSGRLRDPQRVLVPCDACGGRGFFTERICPDCRGAGREITDISLEITIPAGMLPGDELRLAGQGEPAVGRLKAGDLYLTVVIDDHALYRLQGRDLHYRMPVSALAMLAGCEIELPSLAGSIRHKLEPSQPYPRQIRVAGKGYAGRGKIPSGDLVVELQPVFPKAVNAKQRKALTQANALLMEAIEESLPEVAAWLREFDGDAG